MVRKTQKAGRRGRDPMKSSTKFNRRGHRQSRSARGVKRRPYSRRERGGAVMPEVSSSETGYQGGSPPKDYNNNKNDGNH